MIFQPVSRHCPKYRLCHIVSGGKVVKFERYTTSDVKNVITLTTFSMLVSVHLWIGVYLGVRTCEHFLCLKPFVFLGSFVLTSLLSLFRVTCEF